MNEQEIIEKLKSLKLNLEVHPDNEENSEFADRIIDLEEIILALTTPKSEVSAEEVLKNLLLEIRIDIEDEINTFIFSEHKLDDLQSDVLREKLIMTLESNNNKYLQAMHDFANNSNKDK